MSWAENPVQWELIFLIKGSRRFSVPVLKLLRSHANSTSAWGVTTTCFPDECITFADVIMLAGVLWQKCEIRFFQSDMVSETGNCVFVEFARILNCERSWSKNVTELACEKRSNIDARLKRMEENAGQR
jgi:hypothetical protein